MPSLAYTPQIVYNSITVILSLSQMWWKSSDVQVGGSRVLASGVPVAYVQRLDTKVSTTIRFLDGTEYAAVRAWILWAQRGGAFVFRFDKDDAATDFSVYLESPDLKSGFAPERDSKYPMLWTLPITLRSVNATPLIVTIP